MKKTLTLLMLCVVIAATSCKKETIVEPSANTRTIKIDISANDWKLSENQTSYYDNIDVPEIDDYLQRNGAVLVFISFDNEATYEPVSQTYDARAFSYTHFVGGVQILGQFYDGDTPTIENPGNAKVKIVLIDSDQ